MSRAAFFLAGFLLGAWCAGLAMRWEQVRPRPVHRLRWPRNVRIEDIEDGVVAWGDPDVVGIYAKDGRRLTWRDLEQVDSV